MNYAPLSEARSGFTAKAAWTILGLGVVAYNAAAPVGEMLSEGADRALEAHPWLTRVGIGTVALHLANVLPERIDPIHQLMNVIKRPAI